MSKNLPTIACVGTGYWGRNLARNFYELDALKQICDIDEAVLAQYANTYPNVKLLKSFQDVLDDKMIDAVVLATPAARHFEMAKQALEHGKHVYVEKPLALNAEEGQILVNLADQLGRILMVGHLLEYHPALFTLKQLVEKDELGSINYVSSHRLNLGKIRTEEDVLWSFAPHDIGMITGLIGEEPESVSAVGGNYIHPEITDTATIDLLFKSGKRGHIFISWLHPFKEQKLVVVGDKKMAVFDDVAKDNKKLLLFDSGIEEQNGLPVARKGTAQPVTFPDDEPLNAECRHFLNCVRQKKRPRTDANYGLKVLQILEACRKSLSTKGQPIQLSSFSVKNPHFFAHPTAVIDQPCEIGKGTRIWHFSHIMKNSNIGNDCNLGQNVFVAPNVIIGNHVKIQNNVSVYEGVTLEDYVFCGPSMVFTNIRDPRCEYPQNTSGDYIGTYVERGASIGANATIVCGIRLGHHCFIGAGATVTKDVPPYALILGTPGRICGWMCECGERLVFDGLAETACRRCAKKYLKENDSVRSIE